MKEGTPSELEGERERGREEEKVGGESSCWPEMGEEGGEVKGGGEGGGGEGEGGREGGVMRFNFWTK